MREEDLPEALQYGTFMAWEEPKQRLLAALAGHSTAAERYLDLVLLTNIMNSQFEVVNEHIATINEELQGAHQGDPAVEDAKSFTDWAGPWLHSFQSEFDRFKEARDQLRSSLPESERDWAETELTGRWEDIKAAVKDDLLARLDQLREHLDHLRGG